MAKSAMSDVLIANEYLSKKHLSMNFLKTNLVRLN